MALAAVRYGLNSDLQLSSLAVSPCDDSETGWSCQLGGERVFVCNLNTERTVLHCWQQACRLRQG